VPPKVGGAANMLASTLHAPATFLFFLIAQNQKYPQGQSTTTNRP